jgi:hypothetical protein
MMQIALHITVPERGGFACHTTNCATCVNQWHRGQAVWSSCEALSDVAHDGRRHGPQKSRLEVVVHTRVRDVFDTLLQLQIRSHREIAGERLAHTAQGSDEFFPGLWRPGFRRGKH